MKTLSLTPDVCAAIDACRQAERAYVPGRMSSSVVELPRLALADQILRAVTEQAAYSPLDQLAQLPKARPAAVVPKRRRRSA